MAYINTIELSGGETAAEIVSCRYVCIKNRGTESVYASRSPGITADSEGVMPIEPGESAVYPDCGKTLYLYGSGKVTIVCSDSGENFFKTSAQAGGSGADEVARAAISAHAGNTEVHVTAEEKAAWSGKADTSEISNPNLLINPDFAVNQRGITSASGGTDMIFIADRWYASRCIVSNNGHALTAAWDGVTGTNGYIQQQIEGTAELFGKPVTVSLNIDGARRSVTLTVPTEKNQTAKASVSDDIIVGVSNFKATHISVVLFFNAVEHTITNIKAEVGACETGYEIPITADELLKCQRYYQIRSTGDIAAVDMRPSMYTITDIKQRSDGNYEYIAEL